MAGGPKSGIKVHVLCGTCGRPSPTSLLQCPDCGTSLARHVGPRSVHVRDTMVIASQGDAVTQPPELTTVDVPAFAEGAASQTDEVPPFDAVGESSTSLQPAAVDFHDTGTLDRATGVRPRRRTPLPLLTPSSAASSDPPTSHVRRYEDHIDLPPGSVVLDAYEIDAKLGAGAMGEVYAARHLKLGKRVAIKVIAPRLSQDPAAVERFSREARALARIHHPGIVAIEHVDELPDGRAFFVMEHLTGETLDARLKRGPVPFDEALDILDQMARALEAAHRHGVIHRDLKPANTFLVRIPDERRRVVKLLDFGLAKLAVDSERRRERTQAGVALGTPMYLSPEQAQGPNVDARTDIYALGCIGYELVLGRIPFVEGSALALIAAHLHELPPRPGTLWPSIPVALDRVLFDLLAKAPDGRPSLAQLRGVLAGLIAPAAPVHQQRAETYVASPPLPSRAILAALIALAMLCGAAIAIAAIRH